MNNDSYIDGFLLPVPRAHLEQYRSVSASCAEVWKEYGALNYVETVLDDDACSDMRSFRIAADASEDEVVVYSWIEYPSKAVRDEVNTKVMNDPRITEHCQPMQQVFDGRRMSFGGFVPIVIH